MLTLPMDQECLHWQLPVLSAAGAEEALHIFEEPGLATERQPVRI